VYKRLEERKIPVQVLELVLQAAQQLLTQENGTKVYQSKVILNNNETYLLRAFVNDTVEPNRVKSVYITSKIDKYWSKE
jgi:hypothetical protein